MHRERSDKFTYSSCGYQHWWESSSRYSYLDLNSSAERLACALIAVSFSQIPQRYDSIVTKFQVFEKQILTDGSLCFCVLHETQHFRPAAIIRDTTWVHPAVINLLTPGVRFHEPSITIICVTQHNKVPVHLSHGQVTIDNTWRLCLLWHVCETGIAPLKLFSYDRLQE